VIAEMWADGPKSETPPGHWAKLCNEVSDRLAPEDLVPYGEGAPVDRLAWDVGFYLHVTASTHDAAISAWELKRDGLGPRPVTLIRWMAQNGQRSDPSLPSYSEDGLPLVPGLIELITEESSAPGERHYDLRWYIGEIAVWSWPGEPGERGPLHPAHVDARQGLDPLPAPHLRDTRLPRLHLRPLDLQSRGRRGDGRVDRQPVVPGRPARVRRADQRLPRLRGRPEPGRPPAVGLVLRRGRPGGSVAPVGRHPHLAGRPDGKSHTLPLLPLRAVVVFPHTPMSLIIGRPKSLAAVEEANRRPGKEIFLAAQRTGDAVTPEEGDVYPFGTIASIEQVLSLPDGNTKILVEGRRRARITKFVPNDAWFEVELEEPTAEAQPDVEVEALVRTVKTTFERFVKLNRAIPPEMLLTVNALEDPDRLADMLVAPLQFKLEERQELLETVSTCRRGSSGSTARCSPRSSSCRSRRSSRRGSSGSARRTSASTGSTSR
jgi:Lon protease-like protein